MRSVSVLVVTTCLCGLAGCAAQPKAPESTTAAAAAPQGEEKRYDLKGTVMAVNTAGKTLTVNHENIPGFMGAMTMAYVVKDAQQLEHVSAGDQVTAKAVSTGTKIWLEDVAVTVKAPPK